MNHRALNWEKSPEDQARIVAELGEAIAHVMKAGAISGGTAMEAGIDLVGLLGEAPLARGLLVGATVGFLQLMDHSMRGPTMKGMAEEAVRIYLDVKKQQVEAEKTRPAPPQEEKQ